MISAAPGGYGGHGGMRREGRPKLVAVDAAGESVTDGEVMVQGIFGVAGDSDEMMVEAAAAEWAAVAEAKVERIVVAGDVPMTGASPEGGFEMVSDSFYATELAGMVGAEGYEDESAENMQALNGGDEMEGMLGVESCGLRGEAEKTLVQVETIDAETVEVSDSAITEYTEAESGKDGQHARYRLPPLDKDSFRVSSLVWSRLKGHPWWPGEIFDPSDASELALKHQKKGNHLVAFFGDSTFAWCHESQLKPFMENYSQMEKQSSSDAFTISVNHALEELSRRILSGTSCSCLSEELSDNGMSYMVENSGLKDGVTCSTVNQAEILKYFSSESLLHYVKSLALSPGQGGDLLDLVIACSQLASFYRSKGCPELASFQTGSAWIENGMDTLSTKNVMLGETVTNEVQLSHVKPKRGRGRPRKQKPDDNLELTEKKPTSNLNTAGTFDDAKTKTSTQTFDSSFKIGESIQRAASQLRGPSSIVKPQNGPTVHNTGEAACGEFDISSNDAVNEFPVKKWAKRRCVQRHHCADPKDLLAELCSAAIEPTNGCSFSAMAISYFSDYRNYAVSASTEVIIIGKVEGKRSGKLKKLPSLEVETTDHMQDAYWCGLSLINDPIHSLRRASDNTRPRRRRRPSRRSYVPSSDLSSPIQYLQLGTLGPNKKIQVIERSIIHVDEKMIHEVKPTALVLTFRRSTALPSEIDLIRMFSRYGPLKETETEVHKNTNTVQVVFKKRVDAERAFSVAGKYGFFGPSLRSFRLVNMPFPLSTTESNYPKLCPEDSDLEVPAPRFSGVLLDSAQVDIVDKADKAV